MPQQRNPRNDTRSRCGGTERPRTVRLKKRADFVRTARGMRAATPGLVLQCRPAPKTASPDVVRVGFTATKKLGGAVVRNRVKRRLRAAAAQVIPGCARPGHDYVLIGRSGTAARPFTLLVADLKAALRRVHRPAGHARQASHGAERNETQPATKTGNASGPSRREKCPRR